MNPKNPFESRWRWWYPAIADCMIANPGYKMADIAKELGRATNTIGMIVNTDLFKDYLANRRKEWEARHDHALRAKTTKVALSALDILSEQLEKKRDTIPINAVAGIATNALDRLGYSPNKPAAVQVNNYNGNGAGAVVMPVNADALQEAREAIRVAQQKRAALAPPLESSDGPILDLPAERNGDSEPGLDSAVELPRTVSAD